MRVIVIDAKAREVREAEVDGKLESLQAIVGGWIELVRFSEYDDLYVNEEGLINGTREFFLYEGFHPLAGSGVLIGNDCDGGQKSTDLSVEEVREKVGFLTVEEVRNLVSQQTEGE